MHTDDHTQIQYIIYDIQNNILSLQNLNSNSLKYLSK